MSSCPTLAELRRFLQGDLGAAERQSIDTHLAGCAVCGRAVEMLQAGAPGTAVLPAPSTGETTEAFLTDSPAAEDLPAAIGAYAIEEELGRGGMGIVLRARDPRFDRPLAVKVLRARYRDNPDLRRRFLEEAQTMGRLQHPGVPPVHDLGQLPDGRPFLVMKLIHGQTFAALLKQRKQELEHRAAKIDRTQLATRDSQSTNPDPSLLGIFEQVCQTLAYAHSQGIIHRDLKPDNVMVGAFGEVQVMDWGLAKQVRHDEGEAINQERPPSAIPHSSLVIPESAEKTGAGSVLGTPAYMAPEQARGEVATLDKRADVFGLGAILCEILTGKPAFAGSTATENLRMAMKGDLADACARLADCGADRDLIDLARRCLAAVRDDRPRDGAAVAGAVATYQAAVRDRLRRAELDRARAEVKAAEERKRRRISRALMAVALVFFLALAGAAVWYAQEQAALTARRDLVQADLETQLAEVDRQRQELHRLLDDPLEAARLLSDIQGWKIRVDQLRSAWQRADTLGKSGRDVLDESWAARLEEWNRKIAADEGDLNHARQLDKIRQEASATVEGKSNWFKAPKEYPQVFADMGYDAVKGDPPVVAGQVQKALIRYTLVAALDYWADVLSVGDPLVPRLMQIARLADPDPRRDQVRDHKNWKDPGKLLQLAHQAPLKKASPQIVTLLARKLKVTNPKAAIALLRQALVVHPKDFWLHFEMGLVAPEGTAMAGCFQAALAVRPDSPAAHLNLGAALQSLKDLDGAMQHYAVAIKLDGKYVRAHHNMGYVWSERNEVDKAITCYQKAIEIDPGFVPSHCNLGLALFHKKDLDRALAHCHKALAIDPGYVTAYLNLAQILREKNDPAGATKQYQQALVYQPSNFQVHFQFGEFLSDQKDWAGAIKHYQQAVRLDAKSVSGHIHLGMALREIKDLKFAHQHLQKAIFLDPASASAYYHLGLVLADLKDLKGARAAFLKATQLRPDYAKAHYNLGTLLLISKTDLAQVVEHLTRAIAGESNNVDALNNLGVALGSLKDLSGAIAAYQKAIAFNPDFLPSHLNLGLALRDQGKFADALRSLRKAQELAAKYPGAGLSIAKHVSQCERLLELEAKLPAYLKGQAKAATVLQALDLALLCRCKKLHVRAVQFYDFAFAANPKQAAGPHGFTAACDAVLAAAGHGQDAADISEKDRAALRAKALTWLRTGLAALQQVYQANPQSANFVLITLHEWQQDPELASVRGDKALAQLPEAERPAWQQLWAEVEKLCLLAQNKVG